MTINTATVASLGIEYKSIGVAAAITALKDISAGVVSAGSAVVNSYADYERLGLSIQTLVAREKLQRDSSLGMADALAQSSGEAQKLLAWQQRLAIDSPFTSEGVSQAFATAESYGFISDSMDKTAITAKRLTQDLVDYVAGSGRAESVTNNVAFALGQMRTAGKVNAQDINQLTNAGVAANDYLARAFHTTTDSILQMREKGLIPADKAVRAIVEGLEHDFGGAALRQGQTIAGILSSISDVQTISTRTVVGPFLEAIKPEVASFVSYLQSPAVTGELKAIGEDARVVGQALVDGFDAAKPSIAAIGAGIHGTTVLVRDLVGGIAALAQYVPVVNQFQITPSSVSAGAVPLVTGLTAAYILNAKAGGTVAESYARTAAIQQSLNGVKQAGLTVQAAELALNQAMVVPMGTRAELDAAQLRLDQAITAQEVARAEAQTLLNTSQGGFIQGIGQTVAGLRTALPIIATQAVALGLVTVAVGTATKAYSDYESQLDRMARAQFSPQTSALDALEASYRKLANPPKDAVQQQQADIDQLFQHAKEQHEAYIEQVKGAANRAAIISLVADAGNIFTQALTLPLEAALRGTVGVLKVLLAPIFPDFARDADSALAQMHGYTSPFSGWAADARQAAVITAQTADVVDRANQGQIQNEMQRLALLQQQQQQQQAVAQLAADQTKTYGDLSNAAVDYREGEITRAADYRAKLADIERNKNEQLLDLNRQYWQSVKSIRDAGATDTTSALENSIGGDAGFVESAMTRRDDYQAKVRDLDARHNEEVRLLAKQGAYCRIDEANAGYAKEQRDAQTAYQQQESQAAVSYAKQQAQQVEHLGRMLVDYTTAQGLLLGVSQGRIDQMTAAIRQEYGIQQSLAERTFGNMRGVIDQWAHDGGQSTDSYIDSLSQFRQAAVATQVQIDQLTKVKTDNLTQQFASGKITLQEYIASLQSIPKSVSVDLGLSQTGAVASEKIVQLDRDTAQKRYDISVTQYRKQVEAATKAYHDQEQTALLSYGRQVRDLEANLTTMDGLLKASTDKRLAEQVRAQVALNGQLDAQLRALYARKDSLPDGVYERELRAILARAAAQQSTVPSMNVAPPTYQEPPSRSSPPATTYPAPPPPNRPGTRGYSAMSYRTDDYATLPAASPRDGRGASVPEIHIHLHGNVDSVERVRQIAKAAADEVMRRLDDQVDQTILAPPKTRNY